MEESYISTAWRPGLLVLSTGLAVPTVGVNAFATASKYIDKVIVVKYVLMRTFLLLAFRFIVV